MSCVNKTILSFHHWDSTIFLLSNLSWALTTQTPRQGYMLITYLKPFFISIFLSSARQYFHEMNDVELLLQYLIGYTFVQFSNGFHGVSMINLLWFKYYVYNIMLSFLYITCTGMNNQWKFKFLCYASKQFDQNYYCTKGKTLE